MPDHLHIVARFRPDRSVSEMVRLNKANSSEWVDETRGRAGRFEWQTGYGAFTFSESQVERVREYVRNQEEHHRTRRFRRNTSTSSIAMGFRRANATSGVNGLMPRGSRLDREISPPWGSMGAARWVSGDVALSTGSGDPTYHDATSTGLVPASLFPGHRLIQVQKHARDGGPGGEFGGVDGVPRRQ